MHHRHLPLVLSATALLGASAMSLSTPAAACIAGLVSETSAVTQDSQIVLVSVRGAADAGPVTTDVALLLSVPAAGEDFGALVPLPGDNEPTIDATAIDAEAFATIEARTRPSFFVADDSGGSGGCGCASDALGGGRGIDDSNVIASPPVTIGPVVAQWLLADDSAALTTWLSDNGYVLPAGGEAITDTLISEGKGFLAFKRADGATDATSVGVHFTLTGDVRVLPLRMAAVGGPDVLPITVFVANATAVSAGNPWRTVHVADLDPADAVADYAGAIDAITATDPHTFVFESAVVDATIDTALDALVDDGATISRFSARIPKAALDVDAVFDRPAVTPVGAAAAAAAFRMPRRVDIALLGLMGGLGGTVMLRRRCRRL